MQKYDRGYALNTVLSGEIKNLLEIEGLNEIMINAPHKVYIEVNGEIKKYDDKDKKFTAYYLEEVAKLASIFCHQEFSRQKPILSGVLPTGERIQMVMPPACDMDQFVISVRKPATKKFTLDMYEEMGYFEFVNKHITLKRTDKNNDDIRYAMKHQQWKLFFETALKARKNIICAGATSSGKTTLTNCLLNLIPKKERIITIENAREVLIDKEDKERNMINLLTTPRTVLTEGVTFQEQVENCLRLRPDRIIPAELRGAEAFDFINALSTGHDGGLTSVHANSADKVVSRLVTMIKLSPAGQSLKTSVLEEYIKDNIDIVTFSSRVGTRWVLESAVIYD